MRLVANGFDGHLTSGAFLAFLFPDLKGLAVAANAWVLDFFELAVVNGFIIKATKED